jgi:hypothetical protein
MVGASGTVPLIGLRRPFSSQAERLSAERVMKKSKAVVEQPVGIVISTGSPIPNAPRVRAYFWFESEPQAEEAKDQM